MLPTWSFFDFDNSTGVVSNAIHLGDFQVNNTWGLYGLEFSPDGSRLYVTQEEPAIVVQYDLLAGSPAAIIASADTVAQLTNYELIGTLQNGPDGKTYITRLGQSFLACINDPNVLGTGCNFVDNAVNLGSGYAAHGLPNFMSSFFCSGVVNQSSAAFAANDTDVCEKFCVDFFDSSSNNPTAWQWIFPGGNPSSSTDQNPSPICYTTPGSYDVTLITTNANGNDTLTLPDYITVFPTPPFPTITQSGYTLTSSLATTYQWQLNSVDIPGATNQSYAVMQTGLYTVIAGDANGCINSATQYVLITGIQNVTADVTISIYPDPSSGSFTLELLNAEGEGNISIDVRNTLGQLVFTSIEKVSGADWKKEIDLNEGLHSECQAARGVYFLEVRSEKLFLKKKIIITN